MIRQDHRVVLETRFMPYRKATAGRNMLLWCFGPGVKTLVQFGLTRKKIWSFWSFRSLWHAWSFRSWSVINDYSKNVLYFPKILIVPKILRAYTWYFSGKGYSEYILGNHSALNPDFCTLLHTHIILVFSSQLGFTFFVQVELFKTKWLKR